MNKSPGRQRSNEKVTENAPKSENKKSKESLDGSFYDDKVSGIVLGKEVNLILLKPKQEVISVMQFTGILQ